MEIIDIIAYIVLFGVALYIKHVDDCDWYCPYPGAPEKECSPFNGMPIRDTKPQPGDSAQTLLNKISMAAHAEETSIKWRKAFYISTFLGFLIFALIITPGTLPKWYILYATVIVLSGGLYFFFNWYSFHRFRRARENIEQAVKDLLSLGFNLS